MRRRAGRGQPMPQIRKAVETDEQGRFSFTGLDPGKYRLSADRQGFLHQNYGARKYSGSGTPVLVAEGQTVKGIVFQMNPQAVITGKVLDEDGEPVANLQVRAHALSVSRRDAAVVAGGQREHHGHRRIPAAGSGARTLPGVLRMRAMPGCRRAARADRRGDAGGSRHGVRGDVSTRARPNSTTAVPVDVGAGGEIRGIDIRLVKTRVYRVRGKVAGAADQRNRDGDAESEGHAGEPVDGDGERARGPVRDSQRGAGIVHRDGAGARARAGFDRDPAGGRGGQSRGRHRAARWRAGKDVQGGVKVVDATTPPDLKNLSVMLRPVGFQRMGAPATQPGRGGS